jgi:hypothetical protein
MAAFINSKRVTTPRIPIKPTVPRPGLKGHNPSTAGETPLAPDKNLAEAQRVAIIPLGRPLSIHARSIGNNAPIPVIGMTLPPKDHLGRIFESNPSLAILEKSLLA